MEKREKVLIALMIIALGYGAFELFVRPAFKTADAPSSVNVDEAMNLSQALSKSLVQADLGADEKHVLEKAAAPWAANPFYDWPHPRAAEAMETGTKPALALEQIRKTTAYSGYLEMGRTRIAVINGLEYRVGETLVEGDYVVERITPASVTLMAEQSQQEITIPYQDAVIEE
jgi:hypothetical protein